MLRLAKIALLAALSTVACTRIAGGPPDTGISAKKFVAVMVELGSARAAEKPAILRKHGVSDAQLQTFIKAHDDHPAALGVVFDSIQSALDRKREQIQ